MREQLEKLAAGDTMMIRAPRICEGICLGESIEDSAWCGIANTIRDPILALLDLGAEHFAALAPARPAKQTAHGWVAAPPLNLSLERTAPPTSSRL